MNEQEKIEIAKQTASDIIGHLELCTECPWEFTTCPRHADMQSEDCEPRDIISKHILKAIRDCV